MLRQSLYDFPAHAGGSARKGALLGHSCEGPGFGAGTVCYGLGAGSSISCTLESILPDKVSVMLAEGWEVASGLASLEMNVASSLGMKRRLCKTSRTA